MRSRKIPIPIRADFGIDAEPVAKANPMLKRTWLGYPKLPTSAQLRSKTEHFAGGSLYTDEELQEIILIATTRAFVRLGFTVLRWATVAYVVISAASSFWKSVG